MKEVNLSKTSPVDAQKLWSAWFYDKAFQDGINKVFRITTFDIEIEEEGAWPEIRINRTMKFDTDRNIPKPLLKLVRGVTQVVETATLDGAAGTLDVDLELPVIGSRVTYGYRYSWKSVDQGGLEIQWRGHCDVRIPLVRGLAENYLLGELEEATHEGSKFVSEWFAK